MNDDQIKQLEQLLKDGFVVLHREFGTNEVVQLKNVVHDYDDGEGGIREPVVFYDHPQGHYLALWNVDINDLTVLQETGITFDNPPLVGTVKETTAVYSPD